MVSINNSRGFTLIELLVVMTIISVLTAIAVPQFEEYRAKSYDIRAQVDLRNAAIAEEAYFLDAERYLSCDGAECEALPGIARISEGTELTISAGTTSFTGTASHPRGTGTVYVWNSLNGGLLP